MESDSETVMPKEERIPWEIICVLRSLVKIICYCQVIATETRRLTPTNLTCFVRLSRAIRTCVATSWYAIKYCSRWCVLAYGAFFWFCDSVQNVFKSVIVETASLLRQTILQEAECRVQPTIKQYLLLYTGYFLFPCNSLQELERTISRFEFLLFNNFSIQ